MRPLWCLTRWAAAIRSSPAVGLLPIAVAGIDLEALMGGAAEAMEALSVPGAENPAWQYAAARHALYTAGQEGGNPGGVRALLPLLWRVVETALRRDRGPEGKALFPASVEFTADLHSMGQYIQQGERLMLETVVRFARSLGCFAIPDDPENVDGLDFLSGKRPSPS